MSLASAVLARHAWPARGNYYAGVAHLAVQPRLLPVGQHGTGDDVFIIGKESGGLFGSAQYLVLALQMFLHYFGILMAPRLMVWHKANLAMFRRRVLLIAGGASAVGLVAFGVLWASTDWLYPLLFGEAFASAAGLLPWCWVSFLRWARRCSRGASGRSIVTNCRCSAVYRAAWSPAHSILCYYPNTATSPPPG